MREEDPCKKYHTRRKSMTTSRVINSLGRCDGCGAEVSDEELYKCGERGKKYCEQCARL